MKASVSARIQSLPKQPPHSIEAEQSVLGGLLLNNALYFELADKLTDADFYRADHQLLYRGIGELIGAGKPCDFVTLTEHLRHQGRVDEAGGPAYVASLAVDTYSIANIKSYARIVRERAVLRGLIACGSDLGDMGYNPDGRTLAVLLDLAEQKVFKLRGEELRAHGSVAQFAHFVRQAEAKIDAAHRAGGRNSGISTGLLDLDNKTDGLHEGDLVVVAARPGLGKTSLALTIAEYVSIDLGKPSMVFSMEMTGDQLAMRSIAGISKVSLSHLRGGRLDGNAEWDRVVAASARLSEAQIYVDPTESLSPLELRARARRQAARTGLSLVVVDYLQLMKIPGFRENREREVGEVSRSMKALAKELRVPVLLLSQLNRASEKEDRAPRLSDLRDSGSIEQDADLVLFIHRDERDRKADVAQVFIGKQRNGPTGSFRLKFSGEYCRFDNCDPNMEIPLPEMPPAAGLERIPD